MNATHTPGSPTAPSGEAPARETVDQSALRADLVARAAGLVERLRAAGGESDARRTVSEELVAEVTDAGLFRVCAPAEFGGYEGNLRTYMDVVAELGRGDGSMAWIAFLANNNASIIAQFPPAARDEVFRNNPDARSIAVLAPTATTTKVDGGFRVSATWGFASGSLYADWALNAAPLDDGAGGTESGLVLIPMSKLRVEDTWFAAGMRGTGSNTVIAEDVFVPDHMAMPLSRLLRFNGLGNQNANPSFRQAFAAQALIVVAAPLLGLAQAALELTLERVTKSSKRISYSSYTDLRDSPAMQMRISHASSLISTGRMSVIGWTDRIVAAAEAREELSVAERAQLRVDLGTALGLLNEAVNQLMFVQGASGFMESNPFQRVWRDFSVGLRHGLVTPEVPADVQALLLLDRDHTGLTPFI
ncbi:acyl-CoA dehydrogenase-like [Leucobacter sp. 7(1)]|uniref:acyl-CoA dehydrogenase family protein n=1 Tax=Leucobacter sp. 7(1) TaxID=1255613 RepID=UPI00097E9C2A|nr:acyl-CoA dehydrogenase family protein [Leucobacter sp. 7(1)]SJN11208.1 acyl-CoA dehydrogenase-like [Leucobacter sp. 7(1)]